MTIANANRELDLGLERLEDRRMLAGNVEVSVTGNGDLVINGDDLGNVINVSTLPNGDFRVQGFDGTTINEDSTIETFGGVTDDVRINLRAGDNRLFFDELDVPDLMSIRMGDGSDSVRFNGQGEIAQTIGGDLNINTGSGSDSILNILGKAFITVGDDLTINTGSGNDNIELAQINTQDRVSINMGSGDDSVAMVDDSAISATTRGRMRISTGSGRDSVTMIGTVNSDRLDINTGSGNDEVHMEGATVTDRLSINLSRDDDELTILEPSGDDFRINGGSGIDLSMTPEDLLEDMRNFEGEINPDTK